MISIIPRVYPTVLLYRCLSFHARALGQHRQINQSNSSLKEDFELKLARLSSRALLRVSGFDCFSFIQLFSSCNLQTSQPCQSSFLVNENGRILCDFLLYRLSGDVFDKELRLNGLTHRNFGKRFIDCLPNETQLPAIHPEHETSQISSRMLEENGDNIDQQNTKYSLPEPEMLLIECDSNVADPFVKTLLGRRVRERVQVERLSNCSVFCVYPSFNHNDSLVRWKLPSYQQLLSERTIFTADPRLSFLGYRLLTSFECDENQAIDYCKALLHDEQLPLSIGHSTQFKQHQYRLGIGEGLADFDHARLFLLECNADYLNSLSFEKGNFLGNRPTSRVYSRQNLLNRMYPFELVEEEKGDLFRSSVKMPKYSYFMVGNRKIGFVVNISGKFGIGIFRVDLLAKLQKDSPSPVEPMILTHEYSGKKVRVNFPFWWPSLQQNKRPAYVLSQSPFDQRLRETVRLMQDAKQVNIERQKKR